MDDTIKQLVEENKRLRERIRSLERWLERTQGGLHGMLKRRGLAIHRVAPSERLLVPEGLSEGQKDRLYGLLLRYSFRLTAREVIRLAEGFEPSQLTTYCSQRIIKHYMNILKEMGIVEQSNGGLWSLCRKGVRSFGETLEWLVAEIFRREFCAQTLHSISFKMSPPGGDFDVIAAMEGLLVYVEVKSSPPRGIEAENVRGFLQRHGFLCPHISMFFVDTQLRMKDKMVPIFDELLGPTLPGNSQGRHSSISMERLEREIFHHQHRIYLLNASRGIVHNFRVCFIDFLRHHGPL